MSRPLRTGALLLLASLTAVANAQTPSREAAEAEATGSPGAVRPRLALALSGGGARGIAHIGVLRALDEGGIPVDAIAGNSMGAIVGAIFATGRSAGDLEQAVLSLDWGSLFSGRADRRVLPVARRQDRHQSLAGLSFDRAGARLPASLLADHRVNRFLIEHLAPAGYGVDGDFDALPIRLRVVATDLGSGERVVLSHGDLALAVRASMSLPVVFPPVDWEGRRLVDGLVVNNLPVDVARGFDPLVLVSVDISSPRLEASGYRDAIGVATQVNDLLMEHRNREYAAPADVEIRPDLGRHSAVAYSSFDGLIRKGYEATRAQLPAIRERLAAAGVTDLRPREAPVPGRRLEGAPIRAISVVGARRLSERLARRFFNVPVGPGFSMSKGLRAFDKLDASGLLDSTWLEFLPEGDGVRLQLRVTDAAPNRIEVGFGFAEWTRARGHLRLINQNTLGFGEQVELLAAASDAETLLAASLRGERLIVAGLGYRATAYSRTDKPRFFSLEGQEINRGRFQRDGFEAALRSPLERWGLVEAGVRFGRVATRARAGLETELPAGSDDVGAVFGSVTVDVLDSLDWPEQGGRLVLSGEWSPPGLGASHDYWRTSVEGRVARRLGRWWTLEGDGLLGLSGGELPPYEAFRLGGVKLLPGHHHEELKGREAFAGAVSLRYRFAREVRVFGRLGAGNVASGDGALRFRGLRWGASLGAYYPTRLGPTSFEVGVGDDGSVLSSLSVGWE